MQKKTWPLAAALALTFSSIAAFAHDFTKNEIFVGHPWARPSMAAHVPAAVYLEIINRGEADDRLIEVKTGRAKSAEIHSSQTGGDGMMRMRPAKDGVAAPAGETISMETGAYHIMLIGLDGKLVDGESFPLVLTFENAGDIEVAVKVEDRALQTPQQQTAEHTHH